MPLRSVLKSSLVDDCTSYEDVTTSERYDFNVAVVRLYEDAIELYHPLTK